MLSRFLSVAKKMVLLSVLVLTIFSSVLPLTVTAQDPTGDGTQPVVGFAECDFDFEARLDEQRGSSLISCLESVLQFMFVIGIFLIAFRIALSAFSQFNPNESGQAVGQSIKLVWDLVIGLMLIGAPALVIGVVNNAALNLNFIDFSGFQINDGLISGSDTRPVTNPTGSGSNDTDDATLALDKTAFDSLRASCNKETGPLDSSANQQESEDSDEPSCEDFNNELDAFVERCDFYFAGFVLKNQETYCNSAAERYGSDDLSNTLKDYDKVFEDNIDTLTSDYRVVEPVTIVELTPRCSDQTRVFERPEEQGGDYIGCNRISYVIQVGDKRYNVKHFTGPDFLMANNYIETVEGENGQPLVRFRGDARVINPITDENDSTSVFIGVGENIKISN